MTGTEIAALAVSAAGSVGGMLMQQSALSDAQDQRNKILQASAQLNQQQQQKTLANIDQTSQQYTGANQAQGLNAAETAATGKIQAAIDGAKDANVGPQYGGTKSDAYIADKADRAATELKYGRMFASLLGRNRAFGDLSTTQAFNNSNAAIARDTSNANYQGFQGANNLALQSVQPDGTMMMLGDVAKTLPTMYASSKLGAPKLPTA